MASDWSVRLTAEAQAGLDDLLKHEGEECHQEALEAIQDLAEDPSPAGSASMRNANDYYLFYVCHKRWRVIYRVFSGQSAILVDRVGRGPQSTAASIGGEVYWRANARPGAANFASGIFNAEGLQSPAAWPQQKPCLGLPKINVSLMNPPPEGGLRLRVIVCALSGSQWVYHG